MRTDSILKILKDHKETFFRRPETDIQTAYEVIRGKKQLKTTLNLDMPPTPIDGKHEDFDPLVHTTSFGEYLNELIYIQDITLDKAAKNLNVSLKFLYKVLDNDILPWELEPEFFIQVSKQFDPDKKLLINVIRHQPIRPREIKKHLRAKQYNIAARSNKDMTDQKRKKQLEKILENRAIKEINNTRMEYIQILERLI